MTAPWLPALVPVEGTEDAVLPALHSIFVADFKVIGASFCGLPIVWNTAPSKGRPYEEGFVHLVTSDGPPLMRREFDPSRAARIRWCKATMSNCQCPSILQWRYVEGSGAIRTYIWCRDAKYLVVLEHKPREGSYYLVTAFHAEGSSTDIKLRRKYEKRER
jgi:hypothetical protein